MTVQSDLTHAMPATPVARRVGIVLLLTRLSIFIAFIIWVIDKFARPDHAAAVVQSFYGIAIGNTISYVLGILQLVILIGFVIGFKKRITYGFILLMHAASTLVSFPKYLAPFADANILFFASWPMLAACFALYYLRDLDTLWTVEK